MKKIWTPAEMKELNINATAQNPTSELAVDDYQNGWFKQGVGEASGSKTQIDYYPEA